MDVWFCIEQEQSPRGKNRERKNLKKLFTRSSSARQESFFLLTQTYHGSPVRGSVVSSKDAFALMASNAVSGTKVKRKAQRGARITPALPTGSQGGFSPWTRTFRQL
jgi:hypothetical protein